MRILYGVTGEGLGHAMRSRVVAQHLFARGHEVKLVASGRARDYLARSFPDVERIPGFAMAYRDHQVSRARTLGRTLRAVRPAMRESIAMYRTAISGFQPDVCISDFDSFSYLFAKRHSLPIISIDNQQVIHKCKHDDDIKEGLRADFQATRAFVKAKLPGCDHYVITSFFPAKVRDKFKDRTTMVPPILREPVLRAEASRGDHVLVYQTSQSDETLFPTLSRLRDQRFVVYGRDEGDSPRNVVRKSFSEDGFVRDLASARAVVCNGGLSLLGEAIYLGKPILSVPVRHQFEQEMNARYVEKLGYGTSARKLDPDVLSTFLRDEEGYARAVRRHHHQDGNDELFSTLGRLLKDLRG